MPISRLSKPRLVITMGDPSGIGPEVTVKALASRTIRALADFFVVGERSVVEAAARSAGVAARGFRIVEPAGLPPARYCRGSPSLAAGKASIAYIDCAVGLIRSGAADALVTAPINKAAVKRFLPGFEGHTEYLAALTHTKTVGMMFVSEKLRITLATRHIALKDVPRSLTAGAIGTAIALTHRCLIERFGIRRPRIGVAALNPHGGEGGRFGDEEARVIAPAIRKAARRFGAGITGPVVPDVVFYQALRGRYDAVIAMYHDQALGPFKMLFFADGINMTLGLPFVRTSPDHGTAFDIAGKGIADPASMSAAITLAARLAGAA